MKKPLFAVLALAISATTLAVPASVLAQAPPAPPAPATPAAPTAPAAPAAPSAPAAPAAPAASDKRINGKWHFVFDTSGGDREFSAEFTVDADGNVTGTWEKEPATGTFKDGHLLMVFDVTSEEANETAPLHLDGKFDDSSTLTGNWQFSSYDGTFKATHPAP